MIKNEHEVVAPASGDKARGSFTLRGHVIAQLDHVRPDERAGMYEAVAAFARGELVGTPIPGRESLFTLQAAPELLVFVRRESDAAVEVFDIVRPGALQAFADAAHAR